MFAFIENVRIKSHPNRMAFIFEMPRSFAISRMLHKHSPLFSTTHNLCKYHHDRTIQAMSPDATLITVHIY